MVSNAAAKINKKDYCCRNCTLDSYRYRKTMVTKDIYFRLHVVHKGCGWRRRHCTIHLALWQCIFLRCSRDEQNTSAACALNSWNWSLTLKEVLAEQQVCKAWESDLRKAHAAQISGDYRSLFLLHCLMPLESSSWKLPAVLALCKGRPCYLSFATEPGFDTEMLPEVILPGKETSYGEDEELAWSKTLKSLRASEMQLKGNTVAGLWRCKRISAEWWPGGKI